MKYTTILVLFLATASALRIRGDDKKAAGGEAPKLPEGVTAYKSGGKSGYKEWKVPESSKNTCVNVNKATGVEQPCETPGNSAWNTLTTSRTGKPTDAQAPPYPDHALH